MFYGMWNVVQYFFTPSTRALVSPQLSTQGCLEWIEPQYLPISMGGTSTFEPDIPSLDDPPSVMHSLLHKANHSPSKKRAPSAASTLPSSSSSFSETKVGTGRSVSVSIDTSGEEEDELYADSEFGDEMACSSFPRVLSSDSGNGSKFVSFPFVTKEFIPATMRGWGTKQGHIVKNWKRRYFILTSSRQVTLLRYFKDEQREPPYGTHLCGELNLQYYHLIATTKMMRVEASDEERSCHCIQLIGESALDKELFICIEDSAEFHSWIGALEAHIDYRKEIEEIIAIETASSSSSMWSCVLL
jgi:hypothetical protein